MYVIGTAGHVDHGKSTLVFALTGIDPDRLREEKERGLTIDLGFAWLILPSGREVSIVDVPGHERFIKNMLAGAGGVDLALLVVAADDGPMPQTLEHLAILDLLGVPSAVVALTRCDLADDEYIALVEVEVRELVDATRFRGAPIVRVSGVTGEGLEALKVVLDSALNSTPAKRDLGRPRLPIDRAFSMPGFGVVVTGTLIDGSLEVGQEVELRPGGIRGRVRGLQRHRGKVDRLDPGTRAAVNVSGVRLEDVQRGMVLALPGKLAVATTLDIRLRATGTLPHPVAHEAGVTVLCGTAETQGILRLLDANELWAGGEAWAQVRFFEPLAVVPGDHCILRTPGYTIGGGPIVQINGRRHRRNHGPTLAALRLLLEGDPASRLLDALAAGPLPEAAVAAAAGCEPSGVTGLLGNLAGRGEVLARSGRVYSNDWLTRQAERLEQITAALLQAHPLRDGAPREHVRNALRLDAPALDVVIEAGGAIEQRPGGLLAPAGHTPAPSPEQSSQIESFLLALVAGGASPPTDSLPEPELLAFLASTGQVVDTGAGVVFSAQAFATMQTRTEAFAAENSGITLAQARDLLATSRKYAQAFLEHLDATHVTRREGDLHVLRAPVEARR